MFDSIKILHSWRFDTTYWCENLSIERSFAPKLLFLLFFFSAFNRWRVHVRISYNKSKLSHPMWHVSFTICLVTDQNFNENIFFSPINMLIAEIFLIWSSHRYDPEGILTNTNSNTKWFPLLYKSAKWKMENENQNPCHTSRFFLFSHRFASFCFVGHRRT